MAAVTSASTREEIRAYQALLQRAGFYLATVDSIWGPKTQRAHEAYTASQNPAAGMPPDAVTGIAAGILATARRFVGLTETAPNARWDDLLTPGSDPRGPELRAALIETGWQPGWAYCSAFVEVCWRAGYRGKPDLPLITRAIEPSVMSTFENFRRLGRIETTPKPGAIFLMQSGNTWKGHAGIVVKLENRILHTIEGNTSSNQENREGDGVYAKSKRYDLSRKGRGLWMRGFVNPFVTG